MKKYLLVFISIVIFAFCTQNAKAELISMPEPDPALMHDHYCEWFDTSDRFVFNWVTDPRIWNVNGDKLTMNSDSNTGHFYVWDGDSWEAAGWNNYFVDKPVFRDNVRCNDDTWTFTTQGGSYAGVAYTDVGVLDENTDTVSGIADFSDPNVMDAMPTEFPFSYNGITYSHKLESYQENSTIEAMYCEDSITSFIEDTLGETWIRTICWNNALVLNCTNSTTCTATEYSNYSTEFSSPPTWSYDYFRATENVYYNDGNNGASEDIFYRVEEDTDNFASFEITYPSPHTNYYQYIVQGNAADTFKPVFTFYFSESNQYIMENSRFSISEFSGENFEGEINGTNQDFAIPELVLGKRQLAPTLEGIDVTAPSYFKAWLYTLDNNSPYFYREFSITVVPPDDPMYPNADRNKDDPINNPDMISTDTPEINCDTGTWTGDLLCDLFVPSPDSFAWDSLSGIKSTLDTQFADFEAVYTIAANAPANATETTLIDTTVAYGGRNYDLVINPFYGMTIPSFVPTVMTYFMYIGLAFFLIRKIPDLFPE